MIVRAYLGEATHVLKTGRRRFKPKGETAVIRIDTTPPHASDVEHLSSGGYAARIFVGLSVGDEPAYTLDDVVKATAAIRREQGAPPDASFLAQRGIYSHADGEHVVEEDSVQIVIIDITGSSKDDFVKLMTSLGEKLRERLHQESVIVEIQNRGVVEDVYSVR